MPVFDNLELSYVSIKKQRCPRWVRTCFRLLFGGLTLFLSVAFPFLPALSALIGGLTLGPITYAYPCFMWIAIKKPPRTALLWVFNVVLGSLGMILSALLVAAALWTLADKGLNANFFNP
ncbi:hypothetical protein L6164_004708 [Bauhinia variegata]|nr:hypothetical protein L6164_004708 [Bauhinia variegata]